MSSRLQAIFGVALVLVAVSGCGGSPAPSTAPEVSDPPTQRDYDREVVSAGSWASSLANDATAFVSGSPLIIVGTVRRVVGVEAREAPVQAESFTAVPGKNPEPPSVPFTLGAITHYEVGVDSILKGSVHSDALEVVQWQGVVSRVLYRIEDDVPLVVGERYLLFLTPRAEAPDVFEPYGFVSGQYPIIDGLVTAAYGKSKLAQLLVGKPEADAATSIRALAAAAR